MKRVLLMVSALGLCPSILAIQDLGREGHVFAIDEPSLLDEIMGRLKSAEADGRLERLNNQFVEQVKKSILKPRPVAGITRATASKSWLYDPSLITKEDIFDHKNRRFVLKGTRVNPLEKSSLASISWGEPLLFLDGGDEEQVVWAQKQKGKIVLVKGAPLDLQGTLKRPVFFDQGGVLIKKFGINHIPAIVSQEGVQLKVEEICI
jgi:conjugal transfer pilus assembly protein TraW